MAKTYQSSEFEIEVGGELYVWRLHRRPQWQGRQSDWLGKAIAVRHKDGQREAMLEFPVTKMPRFSAALLQPSHIPTAVVAKAITAAIAAGWEPFSRGKTVTITVDETGG